MLKIKNLTRKKIIAGNARLCRSILSKAIGLVFSKKKALIFVFKKEKIVPLHMLFVFYPIDVLFLNKEKIVVEKKEKFMPFTFYTPKNKAKYIIEIPTKLAKKTKTGIGDKIKF